MDSGKAELRDAAHVWGHDTTESEEMLMDEGGAGCRVACIGPAGKKISLISGICYDGVRRIDREALFYGKVPPSLFYFGKEMV